MKHIFSQNEGKRRHEKQEIRETGDREKKEKKNKGKTMEKEERE